jgi:hypothetical protein
MSTFIDTCLNVGEISTIAGTVAFPIDGNASLLVRIEKYDGGSWDTIHSFDLATQVVVKNVTYDYSSFSIFNYTTTTSGIFRWVVEAYIGSASTTDYTYFEVSVDTEMSQPELLIRDNGDRIHATIQIINSEDEAQNDVYVRKVGESFPDEPTLQITGNGLGEVKLAVGRYYAKVISRLTNRSVTGKNDPKEFWIRRPLVISSSEKNIDNVKIEEITNPFYGNQFIAYFTKIPQVGYYQSTNNKTLNLDYLDKLNETMRGITLPTTAIPMIPISFFGHQNDYKTGVGDGNLGSLSIRFKLDRYLNNYTALLQWSYLKYDWTYGGKNPNNKIDTLSDLEGIVMVDFLDAQEEITRRLAYKVVIENLPSLNLAVDTPEELEYDVLFLITDIDPNKFIVGQPLADVQRIL